MTPSQRSAADPPRAQARAAKLLARKRLTAYRAAGIIATVTLSVTIIGGLLILLTDPTTSRTSGPDCGGPSRPSRPWATETSFRPARLDVSWLRS
jgi:hypothetical protein